LPDVKSSLAEDTKVKAYANKILIPFHMEILKGSDLPKRYILGFMPGDFEITNPSAFHNISF